MRGRRYRHVASINFFSREVYNISIGEIIISTINLMMVRLAVIQDMCVYIWIISRERGLTVRRLNETLWVLLSLRAAVAGFPIVIVAAAREIVVNSFLAL